MQRMPVSSKFEDDAEEDAFAYEHVPLTKVGTIRVRYKTAQPLKPRRFTMEDDAEWFETRKVP